MRQTGPGSEGYVNNLKGRRQCELPWINIRCHGRATGGIGIPKDATRPSPTAKLQVDRNYTPDFTVICGVEASAKCQAAEPPQASTIRRQRS